MTTLDSRSAKVPPSPPGCSPVGSDSRATGDPSVPDVRAPCESISQPAIMQTVPGRDSLAGQDSRPAIEPAASTVTTPVGTDSRVAMVVAMPTGDSLRETNSHATEPRPNPEAHTSRGSNSRPAIGDSAPKERTLGGQQLAADPITPDAQAGSVGSEHYSHAANEQSSPTWDTSRGSNSTARRGPFDAQDANASGRLPGGDPAAEVVAATPGLSLLDPALALAADFLDDVERVKLANENRLRALTRVATDKDGVDRYIGLDASHPVVEQLATMVKSLADIEHAAVLNLQRMLRKHPLGAWVKAQKGIGEKQGARLLASIGDPYWRPELTREDGTAIPAGPRTVSALWAYCGLHVLPGDRAPADSHSTLVAGDRAGADGDLGQERLDAQEHPAGVAARRRKGQQANWSTKAKTRAYLIAESCLKQLKAPCHAADFEGKWLAVHYDDCVCSPYRLVYDRRKAHTSVTRPEWTDGHRHADALRVASKEILKDLWRAAREWHLKESGQSLESRGRRAA